MLEVRFMTLSGEFETAFTKRFPGTKEALVAVQDYAARNGFRNVKIESNDDGIRFTAITPRGRGGRNIAYGDQVYDHDEELNDTSDQ